MIATNLLKNPHAMALQRCLVLGRPKWALPRPGSRVLRRIRALRAAAFKANGMLRELVKPPVPDWWKAARKAALALALAVKEANLSLF